MLRLVPLLLFALLPACTLNLLDDISGSRTPLQECILFDGSRDKIAVININGLISDEPYTSMISLSPSLVESVVSQLILAAEDPRVRAVVLKIDSPGGTVTGSELIRREILRFKSLTNKPVVVSMMGVAASGGYYVALPCDYIYAMPSTITGSVGVIMAYPNFSGLMDKLGVRMEVYKSGENKDIISLFRDPSESDKAIVQEMVNEDAQAFWGLVQEARHLSDTQMTLVKTARIFSAAQAQKIGLIDEVGFPDDAIVKAISLVPDIRKEPSVITYRQHDFPNDNLYNNRMSGGSLGTRPLIDLGPIQHQLSLKPGTYYLWAPAN